MENPTGGVYRFNLGESTKRRTGWTRTRPTHYKSGSPRELAIVPLALLDVLNTAIEDVYLARGIYPGARLINPSTGAGTVVTCSLHRPYFFSFIADVANEENDEDSIPTLRYFDPEDFEQYGWGVASKDGWDFVRLAAEDDRLSLQLTIEQKGDLADFCNAASIWQLGEAVRMLLEELKDKARGKK